MRFVPWWAVGPLASTNHPVLLLGPIDAIMLHAEG